MKRTQGIRIGNEILGGNGSFFVISGPCVIESPEVTLHVAGFLKGLAQRLDIPIIFKASYDKANRTSIESYRGPGIIEGLEILGQVKKTIGLPILSDVHQVSEVEKAAEILDVIQIPAFLSRQTDLIVEAARTQLPLNIKKGQFLSPWDMEHVIVKATSAGNHRLLLTERGTSFGYNNLVVDMRSLFVMKGFGYPVVFDATHGVQLPGGRGKSSGGQREFVSPLARAAVAAGADGVFLEIHPDPNSALSDGPNSLPIDQVEPLILMLKEIHRIAGLNAK
ncbi:MAG: 3-deoxy-8-phosphooctulonate synthase [Deltaproteobacteria bacterium]|nr:3-deoxy-8-phosphooctulonate synthase [Deltaproteobacteria bacterium]MBW2076434.1 3-deoxy-8-phosphooctulonate synthase [Deltaproteobacteria bacterium]MBW2310768.1 3-deoxy-8-phosphooctulonate synthase [Deltaproteobacteria bacterium]RLB31482.1 MAG: 3-deoxy-8-phosphooctulonate synthase [Deltaproteobacteria bacterium]